MSSDFPRTQIEDLSVSRLIIGTNWFLGFSHVTKARDNFIKAQQTRHKLADILEIFFNAGVDTIYGVRPESQHLNDAVKDAEDRTGRKCIKMGTPVFDFTAEKEDADEKIIDAYAEIGCNVCLPHQATTDSLVNRREHRVERIDAYTRMIRQRGMIPGLSTHMPETVPYADESNLDVGTYTQIYNAAGFLMQVEVDWVHRVIWDAKKPVITIKPLAAGRLVPLVGLAFNFATIRDRDMVCVGCLTPDEARECIDISLEQLTRTRRIAELQYTRSKKSVAGKKAG